MRDPLFLASAALFCSACIVVPPAPAASGPSLAGPVEVEVHLAPADRELLERFLARADAVPRASLAPPRASAPDLRPGVAHAQRRRPPEGPILRASYDSGAPLYDGEQVQLDGRWQRNGPWRAWYDSGAPWEDGAYRNGEEHGPWRWWYPDGTPQASGTFDEGAHVGAWTYYHGNGRVMAEGRYAADLPEGNWRTFHEDGSLRSEGEFEHGLRTGRWVFREPDGALDEQASGLYEAGERVGD